MLNTLLSFLPELILVATACVLFLLAVASGGLRKYAPTLAAAALAGVAVYQVFNLPSQFTDTVAGSIFAGNVSQYVKLVTAVLGLLFVLLNWPTGEAGTGGPGVEYGREGPEFFALILLALSGLMLVSGANDLITLFMGIELASIPTYIIVSMSRPLPAAQEAAVKYFFLGAMSAAVLLFGLTYVYGVTGSLYLDGSIARTTGINGVMKQVAASAAGVGGWHMLAMALVTLGLCFKLAAVPFNAYVADVYQGAATPVSAMLSYLPKATGLIALLKVLFAMSGGSWVLPAPIITLLWVLAVLTMFVGNGLGLLQFSIKRTLAYSSVAHSGYLLVGVAAIAAAGGHAQVQVAQIASLLFYIAVYGLMNVITFGVLQLLPARIPADGAATGGVSAPATTADLYEDIAGAGWRHPWLGLAMAIGCLGLTGIPFTAGFVGKLQILTQVLGADCYWLAGLMMVNAAISAGYYLRIIATLYGRQTPGAPAEMPQSRYVGAAVLLASVAIMAIGSVPPVTGWLMNTVKVAAGETSIDLLSRPDKAESADVGQR